MRLLQSDLMRPTFFVRMAILLLPASLGACGSVLVTPTPTPPPLLLRWQGFTEMGSDGDPTRCKQLEIDRQGQARLGYCQESLHPVTTSAALAQAPEMAQRFGTFELKAEQDQFSFNGSGNLASAVWQRALVQWAHLKYGELESGRVCASCPTVMSWFWTPLPDQPDLCAHVYVTNFGYATAEQIKCHPQGDAPRKSADGWLDTGELETLAGWLYARAPFQGGDNYFTGSGMQPVTLEDQAAMQAWAQQVYERFMR